MAKNDEKANKKMAAKLKLQYTYNDIVHAHCYAYINYYNRAITEHGKHLTRVFVAIK